MSTKSCAMAIQWWLQKQNKFNDVSVSTKQIDKTDNFEIIKWIVPDIKQPTDDEINKIIDDYEKAGKPLEQLLDIRKEIDNLKEDVKNLKEKYD